MPRVKRGVMHAKRVRNLRKRTKGFKWGRKSKVTLIKVAARRAGVYAYRDRRNKKREFRKLWNVKLNAAVREHGLSYSKFIYLLKQAKVSLNRKVLAELAEYHPVVFAKVVEMVKPKA
ncbi:TPA: 50S ribosomal protein L20 [Patescibacteria group bacterium]|nr:50S ribosomal protein L20 [Patescibacteria group bacterium]